jgi:hypothetical protein
MPRTLGFRGGDHGRGGAVRSDQQVDFLVADQARIERAGFERFRAVVEQAQLDAPPEQPARLVHFVAPQLEASRVFLRELGMRAGLRDHRADHGHRLLGERQRQAG